MIKKSAKTISKLLIGILFAILVAVLLFCSLLAWQLSKGPIDMQRATEFIEEKYNDNDTQQKIEIGSLLLHWNGLHNPLSFKASDLILSNARGSYLYAPHVDIALSLKSLFMGRLRFKELSVNGIAISVTKTMDGQFKMRGQPLVEKPGLVKIDAIPATVTLNNILNDLPNIQKLRIRNAHVIYTDVAAKNVRVFKPVNLYAEIFKNHDNRRALTGSIDLPLKGGEITQLNFSTLSNPLLLNISSSFKDLTFDDIDEFLPEIPKDVMIDMTVTGDLDIQLDNLFHLHSMNAHMQSNDATIQYPMDNATKIVAIKKFVTTIVQDANSDLTNIESLELITDKDEGFALSGSFANLNNFEKLSGSLDVSLTNIEQSSLKDYWPLKYSDNSVYKWIVEKIDGGVFNKLNVLTMFDRGATTRNDNSPLPPQITSIQGDMAYQGLNIQYHPKLATAKNVSGTGTYDGVNLTLNVGESVIGGLTTKGAVLNFKNLIPKGSGVASLVFPVTAPTQAVFDYISVDPINAFKNTAFKPKNTTGNVVATVTINFPMMDDMPIDKLDLTVDGKLNNAKIDNVIGTLGVTGGPYDIIATTKDIKISGDGKIAGQPIIFDWHQYYKPEFAMDYGSKLSAKLTSNNLIHQEFMNGLEKYIDGNMQVNLNYTTSKNSKNATLDLELDLKNSAIQIDAIGLTKEKNIPTTARMALTLNDKKLSKVSNLSVNGQGVSLKNGSLQFNTTGGIDTANLQNVIYGDNRFSLIIKQQPDKTATANITGSYIDIRPILERKKDKIKQGAQKQSRPINIDINVNEMSVGKNETLKQPKISVQLNNNGRIDDFRLNSFLGKEGNSGTLMARYTPTVTDGLSLRVESDNAGETLRTFNLFSGINDGKLQIAGRPIEGGRLGDVIGKARIDNFSVTNAPVLLRLVNALSFQSFLNADSLLFDRLEADFEWVLNDNGDIYKISNGTTSGTSIAFTFDGFVNTIKNQIDINGTAAPLSEINNLIGNIPIIGDMLTGGGALLAATYSISGDANNPKVSVNPLSVLAPGIIRKMLFESTPVAPVANDNELPEPEIEERKKYN